MAMKTAFGGEAEYQTFTRLGEEIGESRNELELLKQIEVLTGSDGILSQRAATILHHCSNVAPDIFLPHLDKLIPVLKNPIHDSGPRMVFRLFSLIEIPEKYSGTIIDLAFQYIENPKTLVATKVNAMYTIANQAKIYPELKIELEASIEYQYQTSLPAFKACVRKLSKQIGIQIGN